MPAKSAWFDRDQTLIRQFKTGVSIHSHTSCSKESLEFVGRIFESHPLLRTFLHRTMPRPASIGIRNSISPTAIGLRRCVRARPTKSRKNQIEQKLGMQALVSLSDHDCMDAPLLLRVVPAMRETPLSLEWTVPFQTSKFHLGVHNLPGARAPANGSTS